MGTISGQVRLAFQRAARVSLINAQAGAVPGWYGLYLCPPASEMETLLYVGQTGNLDARFEHHRTSLFAERSAYLPYVQVAWLEARRFLGHDAHDSSVRRSLQSVLIALLQPLWNDDGFPLPNDEPLWSNGTTLSRQAASPNRSA